MIAMGIPPIRAVSAAVLGAALARGSAGGSVADVRNFERGGRFTRTIAWCATRPGAHAGRRRLPLEPKTCA